MQPRARTRNCTFPSLDSPPFLYRNYFLRDSHRFSSPSHFAPRKLIISVPLTNERGKRERAAARTTPPKRNINQLFAYIHVSVRIFPTRSVDQTGRCTSRRVHSLRDAFFMAATTWGRQPGTEWRPAASGLSIADGWTSASNWLDWCRSCPRVEIPRTSKYFISARVIDTAPSWIPIFADPPEFRVGLSSHPSRISLRGKYFSLDFNLEFQTHYR